MRLLWHGEWLEAPAYAPESDGCLIEVEASAPIGVVRDPSGRVFRSPLRKLMRFSVLDGPAATWRKARSKRSEPRFSGDYRLAAVLGERSDGHGRVVALAPRVPPFAELLPVSEQLCRAVDAEFSSERFATVVERIKRRDAEEDLLSHAHERYLYSSNDPPSALTEALDFALDAAERVTEPPSVEMLRPERSAATPAKATSAAPASADELPLSVIGAGDYVRIEVARALRSSGLRRAILCDREPQIAALAAEQMGFARSITDPISAISELESPGLVLIATNHDSHARLAALALERGHRVFCEKPTVVDPGDQERLVAAAKDAPGRLEVGFNRRYNPLVRRTRELLEGVDAPRSLICVVREVDIEAHHWYLWPNQGTRVAGNLCHWIDLSVHLIGRSAAPAAISASGRVEPGAAGLDDERTLTIEFDEGSVATLIAGSRGDDVRGVQEWIQVRSADLTIDLDDLRRMRSLRAGRTRRHRTLWRDKGHQRMYRQALGRVESGQSATYPLDDLRTVGTIQLAATELIRAGGGRVELHP